jgi:hypothetical protein
MIKIYGPYTRKDGRKHIIKICTITGNRITQSYPRYLIENKLGRKLLPNEHIDHKNDDYTDDDINNLQILTQKQNNQKEMSRPHRKQKFYEFNCPQCGIFCKKELKYVKGNKKQNKAGPFCSRSCAGKFSMSKY